MFTKWWTGVSPASLPKMRWRLIVAGALAAVLVLTSGCSLLPKEDEEEVLPAINPPKLSKKPEYTVKTDTLITKVNGSGRLMSVKEEELFFTDDNKRIKEVYVKSGDRVEAGQLIAELDVSDEETQLRQKKLQMRKEELAMIEKLRQAAEKSPEQLEQDKIDFELKREDMVKLEESIAKAKLKTPFAGTVVGLYIKKGDMAQSYESVAVVADLSQLTAAAKFGDEDLKKVAVGMEVEVDINGAGKQKGTVKQLPNPNAKSSDSNPRGGYGGGRGQDEPESIDQFLLVELETMPENVTHGTPLSASVIISKKENAVVIPLSALRSITGRNYVQVVDEKGAKKEVDVEIGQQTSTYVEIVKGLTPGQKVVGR